MLFGPTLMVNMSLVWLVAMVVLLIVEAAVPGLVSIWFALGAFCALIAAILKAPLWLQIVWFLAVSIATLCLTRPLAQKYVNAHVQPTNADAVIGREGLVTEAVNNIEGKGAVKIGGKVWTARSADDSVRFEQGDVVTIDRIEGVKLIVK